MTDKTAVIKLGPGCKTAEVSVDGHRIEGAIRALELTAKAGQTHRLHLDLVVHEIDAEIEGVKVVLPEKTRDALLALGWTAPEDDVLKVPGDIEVVSWGPDLHGLPGTYAKLIEDDQPAIEWLSIPAEGVTTEDEWRVGALNGSDLEVYDNEVDARKRAGRMFDLHHRQIHTEPWRPVNTTEAPHEQ